MPFLFISWKPILPDDFSLEIEWVSRVLCSNIPPCLHCWRLYTKQRVSPRRCCKVSRLTLILTSFTSTLRHGRYTITQTEGEMRKKWHSLSGERFSTAVHVCEPSLNALMLKCYVAWPGDHSMFKPSARQLDSLSSCERRCWVESRQSSSLLSTTVQRMTPFAAETCAHPAFSASNPACGSRDRVFDHREPPPSLILLVYRKQLVVYGISAMVISVLTEIWYLLANWNFTTVS
jgi:hypothetical protein